MNTKCSWASSCRADLVTNTENTRNGYLVACMVTGSANSRCASNILQIKSLASFMTKRLTVFAMHL